MWANRNVAVLSVAQALGLAGAPLVILVGGIVGESLAPTPALATLPIASMVVGTALASIPAALLMQRFGRRAGFATGSTLAALACLLCAQAVAAGSFTLFWLATLLIGANLAFIQQYRFAAMESVASGDAGRAVSVVLVGGVVGGLLGPELARRTRDVLAVDYVASFLIMGVAYVLIAALMAIALRNVRPASVTTAAIGRPLRQIAAQPTFRVALAAGIVAYAVMSLIMTATPVSMHIIDAHSIDATALVIQSHIVAMYLPSLFTGAIIARLGAPRVMLGGAVALATCIAVTMSGHAWAFYWTGLVLLGLGWNLLWVGATVLLDQSYREEERFRVQAINDFTVFAVQATAALSAGAILHAAGWRTLVSLAIPAVGVVFVFILPLVHARRSPREAGAAS